MNVETVKLESWDAFKREWVGSYLRLPRYSREQLCFRGHACRDWKLEPTLDRNRDFRDNEDRENFRRELIDEFRRSSYGLRTQEQYPVRDAIEEWEFLGRHHGLPTTILDWTRSPYIAAYFAFEATADCESEYVAIWALQHGIVDWTTTEGVELDEEETIRFNMRAAEQGGLSSRVTVAKRPMEEIVGEALLRIDIPATQRQHALVDLDEMMINRRTLFRDLDGAATAAALRLEPTHGR